MQTGSRHPHNTSTGAASTAGAGTGGAGVVATRAAPAAPALHQRLYEESAGAECAAALSRQRALCLGRFFPEIPEVLEFGAAWSELGTAQITGGSILSSTQRAAPSATAAAAAQHGRATSTVSAAAAKSAAQRVGLMGPSGANAISLGMCRRFLHILVYPQQSQVHILTDDAKVPLVIRVFNRRGDPLEAWDFYVGAVIDILGRPTTLASAAASTQQWIDANAHRLWGFKQALEARVNRFRPKPRVELLHGPFRKLEQPGVALGGTVPLVTLALQVARLEEEMTLYR